MIMKDKLFYYLQALLIILACGLSQPIMAQSQNSIKGVVVDSQGEALIGVSVMVKGTTTGTITDIDGSFDLKAKIGDILLFSYIGYTQQEFTIKNTSSIKITMLDDLKTLDEVVVVGYGTLKKKDLTGSLSSIDSKLLIESNKTNVGAALQGQVAGVDMVKSNGKPGAGYNFMIRGVNKIKNKKGNDEMTDMYDTNPPLFVVDGMFVSSINDIAPEDIDRIDVLKDASSTAIYGSRGANGVVIVSTKRGSGSRSYAEYNGSLTISNPTNLPEMSNGAEYAQYRLDRRITEKLNSGDTSATTMKDVLSTQAYNNYTNGKSVDWADMIYKTGISQSHNARVYGSADGLNYTFGLSYTDDNGIIGNDGYTRYNVSTAIDKVLSKYVKVGLNMYTAYEVYNNAGTETFRTAYRLNPLSDVYDENGEYLLFPDESYKQLTNPFLEQNSVQSENKYLHVFGNMYLEIKPTSWLQYTSTLTPDVGFSRYGEYRGIDSKTAKGQRNSTRAMYDSSNQQKYTWDNMVNVNQTFNEVHKFNGMLGMSWYKRISDWNNTRADGITNDRYQWYNMGAGTMKSMTSGYVQEQLLSYFSRLNYSYKDKYLLTATGRFDGSSRLAPGYKWAFFPSAALAWRMSEESFMKADFLDDLKMRLSYGVSGNDAVSPYQTNLYTGNSKYLFGDTGVNTAYINNLAAKTLAWEKTKEWNLGLDYTVFGGRLSGSVDLYTRDTDDILMARKISEVNGFGSVMDNVGSMRNQGLELALTTVNVKTNDFSWSTNINFTTNKNEITALSDGTLEDRSNQWFVGESMGAIWTYKFAGFWTEEEVAKGLAPSGFKAGSIKVEKFDKEHDELTDDDKVILGSPFPKWTAGMTNNFKYKDLDLSIFIYTRQGQWAHSQFHRTFTFGDDHSFNVVKLNYWTPDNQTNAEWYRPGVENPNNVRDALLYVKTSYVKVGHINLGYNVPKKFLDKVGISKLRLHASCQNPFVFTDYIGWDPESASQNSYTQYPMLRSFVFGVNMTF